MRAPLAFLDLPLLDIYLLVRRKRISESLLTPRARSFATGYTVPSNEST